MNEEGGADLEHRCSFSACAGQRPSRLLVMRLAHPSDPWLPVSSPRTSDDVPWPAISGPSTAVTNSRATQRAFIRTAAGGGLAALTAVQGSSGAAGSESRRSGSAGLTARELVRFGGVLKIEC